MRGSAVRATFVLHVGGIARESARLGAGVASDNYPPYDLERFREPADGRDRLRLVFAVAGFAPHQLEITVAGDQLFVSGEQGSDAEARHFLHRGIAGRRFRRMFRMAPGLDVETAHLARGLLRIHFYLDRPDRFDRTVSIVAGGRAAVETEEQGPQGFQG